MIMDKTKADTIGHPEFSCLYSLHLRVGRVEGICSDLYSATPPVNALDWEQYRSLSNCFALTE